MPPEDNGMTKGLNFIILACLVPFGIMVLISLANGSFGRGMERGMQRMALEEEGR